MKTKVKSHTRVINGKKIRVGEYIRDYNYSGKTYKIHQSPIKGKQRRVISPSGKVVDYGDPSMREFPDTKRENNFCARSYGIKDGDGNPTRNDPSSANFWNRRDTWECRGKKGK